MSDEYFIMSATAPSFCCRSYMGCAIYIDSYRNNCYCLMPADEIERRVLAVNGKSIRGVHIKWLSKVDSAERDAQWTDQDVWHSGSMSLFNMHYRIAANSN